MGLFIIGSKALAESRLVDFAEELVEKELVYSNVAVTMERLRSWQTEAERCVGRGGRLYGYLLEQCDAARDVNSWHRCGAYCVDSIGGVNLDRKEVLEALIELSGAIHREDIPGCDEWLFDQLGAALKQTPSFDLMSSQDKRNLIGIAKAAIRHLQHYQAPVISVSEELRKVFFIRETTPQQA